MNSSPWRQVLAEHQPVEYRVRPLVEAICVFVAVLLATLTTVYFIYAHALEAQKGEIRQGLLRTAHIIAAQIDPEQHRRFVDPAQQDHPEYLAAKAHLNKLLRSAPSIAFIWTAVQQEGEVRFVLDATDAPQPGEADQRVRLLETFENPPEEILRAFETRGTIASEQPYTDRWGSFVSAYVPLRDEEGEFVALVGVDIDAREYFRRLQPIETATVRAMVTALIIATLAALAVWVLRRFILALNRRRLRLYTEFQQQVAALAAAEDTASRAKSGDAGAGERQ